MTTILLLDNRQHWFESLITRLPAEYSFVIAPDGLTGLRRLEEHPVDVIVSEYDLPQVHACAFVDIIRSQDRYKNVPVVLYTNTHHEDIEPTVVDAVQIILPKLHTHFQDLAYVVYRLLEQRRLSA